jgi:hypothetical protein
MNRVILTLAVIFVAGCTGSGDQQAGQTDQGAASGGYEEAVDKARKARSDVEAAMERAQQEIEDNQPPD